MYLVIGYNVPRPVVLAEIATFSSDGFKRSSMSLGKVHDTDEAREIAIDHPLAKEAKDGDYVAFRVFIDWSESYSWVGKNSRFEYDQAWEKL